MIVSVIVGGTSLSGGFGSIWRTAAGLAILASLQNGLNLLQVNTIAQYVVKGLIIIGALGLDVWTRRLRASSEQRSRLDRSNPTACRAPSLRQLKDDHQDRKAQAGRRSRLMLKAQTVRDRGLRRGSAFLRSNGLLIALVVLVVLLTIGDPAFLSPTNLANVLGQWAPAGIMAVAATYVIIGRGFDLSVASGFSLCAIAAAGTAAAGYSNEIAFASALVAGLLVGCFNAALVCGLGINPFIATIGTGFVLLGLDILATPNASITVDQAGFDTLGSGSWHGLPFKGIVLIFFLVDGPNFFGKIQVWPISLRDWWQSGSQPLERAERWSDTKHHLHFFGLHHGCCRFARCISAEFRSSTDGTYNCVRCYRDRCSGRNITIRWRRFSLANGHRVGHRRCYFEWLHSAWSSPLLSKHR